MPASAETTRLLNVTEWNLRNAKGGMTVEGYSVRNDLLVNLHIENVEDTSGTVTEIDMESAVPRAAHMRMTPDGKVLENSFANSTPFTLMSQDIRASEPAGDLAGYDTCGTDWAAALAACSATVGELASCVQTLGVGCAIAVFGGGAGCGVAVSCLVKDGCMHPPGQ